MHHARWEEVFLLREDDGILDLAAVHGPQSHSPPITMRLGEGVAGRAAQSGEPFMITDYRHWEGRVAYAIGAPL